MKLSRCFLFGFNQKGDALKYRAGSNSGSGLDPRPGQIFIKIREQNTSSVGFRTEYFIARGCIDFRCRQFRYGTVGIKISTSNTKYAVVGTERHIRFYLITILIPVCLFAIVECM